MIFTPFSYRQQKIVTDGLILNLDAGNVSSYSGSIISPYPSGSAGTRTWYDLSNSKNNFTFYNLNQPVAGYAPLFVTGSNNSSYIDFNVNNNSGTNANNYSNGGFTVLQNTSYTICCWVYFTALNSYFIQFGAGTTITNSALSMYSANTVRNIRLSFNAGTFRTITSISTLPTTGWGYIVGVWNYGVGASLYLNGTFDSSLADTGNLVTPSGGINVPILASGVIPYYTDISVVNIYNRALTDSEILQNYNVTKGRYGL